MLKKYYKLLFKKEIYHSIMGNKQDVAIEYKIETITNHGGFFGYVTIWLNGQSTSCLTKRYFENTDCFQSMLDILELDLPDFNKYKHLSIDDLIDEINDNMPLEIECLSFLNIELANSYIGLEWQEIFTGSSIFAMKDKDKIIFIWENYKTGYRYSKSISVQKYITLINELAESFRSELKSITLNELVTCEQKWWENHP